jgi:hypothetical protein
MSQSTVNPGMNPFVAGVFTPNWSADDLVAAFPRTMPPLRTFSFQVPANATELHRPRRVRSGYAPHTSLALFRVGR